MRELLAATKALGDESRLRILRLVMEREICVCQIIETMRLAPSTVSKHLLLLKQAGFLESRKRGRWIHYRVAEVDKDSLVAAALTLVKKALRRDRRVGDDLTALKRVLALDREALCRKQAGR